MIIGKLLSVDCDRNWLSPGFAIISGARWLRHDNGYGSDHHHGNTRTKNAYHVLVVSTPDFPLR
jgi:hypothetical protein